jgi:outer membrane lipoprotein-sorting protein
MNKVLLATILALATVSIAAIAAPSIVLAQNMNEGTPEVSKLPAEQNMTGNATNTTITEGVSPNVTG